MEVDRSKPMETKVFNLEDASSYLGISKHTLYKYLKSERIKGFKYPGSRMWKFRQQDLDSWIKLQASGGLD